MSLLKVLGLPAAPRVALGALADSATMQAGGSAVPMFGAGQPAPSGDKNASFDGRTMAMLEKEVTKARAYRARVGENFEVYLDSWNSIEKGLVPYAAKVEAAMKLKPADVAADIRGHVSSRARQLGRNALVEQDTAGIGDIVQQLVGVLLKDGHAQIDVAAEAIEANKTRVHAEELKAKVAEMKEAFERVMKVAEIIAKPHEAALKIISLAGDLAIGASSLKKRADELSELANRQQASMLESAFKRANDYCTNLEKVVLNLKNRLTKTADHLAQLSGEAEGAYDNDSNADRNKPKAKFHFDGINKAVKIAEGSLEALNTMADELRSGIIVVNDLDHWLHTHGRSDVARRDGMRPELDPDYAKQVALVKARMDEAMAEAPKMLKELRKQLTDIEARIAKASDRFDKWTEFYAAAQDALRTAPEPNAKH